MVTPALGSRLCRVRLLDDRRSTSAVAQRVQLESGVGFVLGARDGELAVGGQTTPNLLVSQLTRAVAKVDEPLVPTVGDEAASAWAVCAHFTASVSADRCKQNSPLERRLRSVQAGPARCQSGDPACCCRVSCGV